MSEEIKKIANEIKVLADEQTNISMENVRELIKKMSTLFSSHLVEHGYDKRKIQALMTKFRDAGRRSPPWRPTSGLVPGRPQDGADGNRRNRWLFEPDHRFYADEVTATLVEVRYYCQTISMDKFPSLPTNTLEDSFLWLIDHKMAAGNYLDPIQKIHFDFDEVISEPKSIQSGHLHPLDRGGRHDPTNTFLIFYRSNQLQGNLTIEELLELMNHIVERHRDTS